MTFTDTSRSVLTNSLLKNRSFLKKERPDSKEVLLSICIEAKFYSINAVENIQTFHTLKNIQIKDEHIVNTLLVNT